jgi:hypothetical protein
MVRAWGPSLCAGLLRLVLLFFAKIWSPARGQGGTSNVPPLLELMPPMCPLDGVDGGKLAQTFTDCKCKSTEEEKKKAGRLCTLAAFDLVPLTGIEPVSSA